MPVPALKGTARLCYAGSVFHTKPASLGASRSPIQLGAELYGHAGVESDIEIISLMLETLSSVGMDSANVDLGHVQIYRSLVQFAELSPEQEQLLFDALQRKACCEVSDLLNSWQIKPEAADMFMALTTLAGNIAILDIAREKLASAPSEVFAAIDQLETIAGVISSQYPETNLYFDLGELRGYNYHTGVVFAAYVPGQGQAIAKGGRYDGIGQVFGRARPATGFSTDLKVLLDMKPAVNERAGYCFCACRCRCHGCKGNCVERVTGWFVNCLTRRLTLRAQVASGSWSAVMGNGLSLTSDLRGC